MCNRLTALVLQSVQVLVLHSTFVYNVCAVIGDGVCFCDCVSAAICCNYVVLLVFWALFFVVYPWCCTDNVNPIELRLEESLS